MPELNLLTHYQLEKATDQNQSQLINMYLEEEQTTRLQQYPYAAFPDPPKGEYKVIAYSHFGLDLFCDTLQGQIRALYEQDGLVYCVAGNQFLAISSNGTQTILGTLNTSTGWAKIEAITGGSDSTNQLVIIDGTNGYHYNIGTSTATFPITDTNFNQLAVDITATDDYFVFEDPNSISFFISNLSDGKTYSALDFASKFRKPDRINGIIAYKGEVWLCGTKTIEVWQNSGNNLFPFQRRDDVFIEMGLAAPRALVIAADFLYGFVKSRTGGYAFVEFDSYNAKVISSKAVMSQVNKLSAPSDCICYAYSKDGHEFIDWTFPTDNKTFTYDISNITWVIRSSFVNSTYGRLLGNCHCFAYGKSLIGDFNSGKIYNQSSTTYTENGVPLKRQIYSPPVYFGGKRGFIHRLQIDVQTNVGPNKTFTLEMSTDRGNTWQLIDTYTIPTNGDGQIYTTSLGSSFCFHFRITCTDDCNFAVLGFQADADIGTW